MPKRISFSLIWPPILIAVLFLAAWQAIVVVNDVQPYLLPAPSLIAENFTSDLSLMWAAAFYTGTTAFLGLVFGTIAALIMALLAQRLIVVNRLITPLAAGLATVPIIALTPILNNMFNITSRTPRVLVTMIIVLFPMFVNVTRGLLQVQPVQLELMRSMNAKPRMTLRVLRIPNAIPFFFTGLKIAAPLAVIAALVAEYFGGPQEGLGSRIAGAAANTAYGRAWAYVVASIITGLLFYLIVVAVEKWTTPWTGRSRST
ncbi:MAG: ABC transporter permease [Candidatus Nanopelagicales bacterium]|nr:ABC transporter permease [Candidatus Nanopelagicales bacterium]